MIAAASLFAYPAICALIGIESSRALAFPARSVTLALATPVVKNLGKFIPIKAHLRRFNPLGSRCCYLERDHWSSSRTRNIETSQNTRR